MSHLHEDNNLRDILRYEDDSAGQLSREVVTVATGQTLLQGAVIGKITKAIATTGTADAGNAGGGTVTSVTQGLMSKIGAYIVKCISVAVASPLSLLRFEVTDPDGDVVGQPGAGAFTSSQINLTITDGSPATEVDDFWTIAVSAGSGKVKEIAAQHDAVDGTSEAYGFLTADCTATGDTEAVAIVKNAVIIAANLVWPTTSPAFSEGDKTAALVQLAAKGIVARAEA